MNKNRNIKYNFKIFKKYSDDNKFYLSKINR